MNDPSMNMRANWPSRKAPRSGDVFAFQMQDDLYSFGRVVDTKATWAIGDTGDCQLIYVFQGRHSVPEPPDAVLQVSNFAIPPAITNKLPWSRGYFRTLENREFAQGERLSSHAFHRRNGQVFDEHAQELPAGTPSVGPWVLHGYKSLDDAISRAFGLEPA